MALALPRDIRSGNHLEAGHDDTERWSSVVEIETLVKSYQGLPILMSGDFSDAPDTRSIRELAEGFDDPRKLVGQGEGWTIPAAAPRKRIDYLWISKDKSLVPLKAWVPSSEASDHRPIVAEFELK